MRWIVGIVGGLVALVVIAVVAVVALVNPNDYKGVAIEQAAKAGWELSIDGDMSLAFWPSLAIDLPATRVASTRAKQTISVQDAQVSIAVWPLISAQRVEASTLTLRSPVIEWDLDAALPGAESTAKTDPSTGAGVAGFAIGGVDIQQGQIRLYQGAELVHDIALERLTLGALAPDTWVPIELVMDYQAPGMAPLRQTLTGDIKTDDAFARIEVRDLDSNTGGIAVTGNLAMVASPLALSGSLKVAEFNPTRVLSDLGIALPAMQNPNALTRASFGLTFDDQKSVYARELTINFDDTALAGEGGLVSLTPLKFNLQLSGDQLSVDDYLAVDTDAADSGPDTGASGSPLAAIAGIDGRIALAMGQLNASGLTLTDVDTVAVIEDRRIDVQRLNAQGYDGTIAAKAVVNGRSAIPSMSADLNLSSLQIQGLLADLAGYGDLSGIAEITGSFTAEGANAEAIMASLNGTSQGQLVNGALKGLAIDSLICEGMATLVGGQSKLAAGDSAFDAMRFDSDIRNGVATFNTLNVGLANLQVSGTGSINLPAQLVDMKLGANLSGDSAISGCKVPGALAEATIPLACKGGFSDDPLTLCKLDSSGMSQLLSASAKAKASARIEEEKAALKTKVEAKKAELKDDAKAKLEEKLGGALKGLFK
ncbi:AsmA family protein [Litorivicinus lipolyticus]|uniref:AsmA family protein n=1 Tax=Litorivicinus lipolyticus TaxID=418701 RepID=A0A5Q2QD41_9GAMM|nr:AsmA family protein [Litorivicinus lipolyticus]QGG81233.1 AsmA family protein [Litorivicinus lipolyticus]